jgi:hypothetical protein
VKGQYRIEVRPAALKQLDRIHGPDRARILRRIQTLAEDQSASDPTGRTSMPTGAR